MAVMRPVPGIPENGERDLLAGRCDGHGDRLAREGRCWIVEQRDYASQLLHADGTADLTDPVREEVARYDATPIRRFQGLVRNSRYLV